MMIRLPTAGWISGVRGWKLNHSVTLMASLPTAGVIVLHPGPGAGRDPRPPRGPLGVPVPPTVTASVMKIHPLFEGGSCADPTGLPLLGIGPLGHGLARFSVTACCCTAVATSASVGHWWVEPLGSMKYEARTATRAPSLAACCSAM